MIITMGILVSHISYSQTKVEFNWTDTVNYEQVGPYCDTNKCGSWVYDLKEQRNLNSDSERKKDKLLKIYCGVEQLVARRAHNPKVARSSRVPATRKASQL